MGEILLIGLDLGTQGVRAMLADVSGNVLASASRRYARINVADDAKTIVVEDAEQRKPWSSLRMLWQSPVTASCMI